MSRGLAGAERFLSHAGLDQGPWLTVAFGCGIAAWFVLPTPLAWLAVIAGCLAIAGLAGRSRMARAAFPCLARAVIAACLMAAAGCGVIWARSAMVGEPGIARPVAGQFEATVLAREDQPARGQQRLILALRLPGAEPGPDRPIRVRMTADRADVPAAVVPGARIRIRGRLMPPAVPMLPGGYDFARTAWFAGIAATGTATGPVVLQGPAPVGEGGLDTVRAGLSAHVRSRLAPAEAGIAAALISGDRGGIAPDDADAMRDAGLAHLLSISGLHVGAVIAAVYFAALRLLALLPWLALRIRLPVAAAGAGALAGIGYTLLTGSEVPTVRSCVGALLVLVAMVLGREPLSLRLLAAAAFVVLLLWPEALAGPSFQMSFGAVLAIVALASAGPVRRFMAPRDERWSLRMLRHGAMLLLTGIVVELALLPIGLHHFHRAGLYGAAANVIAIPLTTIVIMPGLALAMAGDLVGAGGPAWWLTGHAIALLLALARTMASGPGAVTLLPAAGNAAFALFVAGALWLCLWSGRARLAGLVPAALGIAAMLAAPPPDLLVSGDGRQVALVEAGTRQVHVLRESRSDFVRANLLELAGAGSDPVPLERWPGRRCNQDYCTITVRRPGGSWILLLARGRDAVPERSLAAACQRADIVVADRYLPRSCRPGWIKADRRMLQRTGGLAVDLARHRVTTVAERQGTHGWWRVRDR